MPIESVHIGRQVVKVGDRLIANENAKNHSICRPGQVVTVVILGASPREPLVGLYSPRTYDSWHSLNGRVRDNHGFWATAECLLDNFCLLQPSVMKINQNISFRNRNLKGMACRIVEKSDSFSVAFVELEENIGAGSADGRGKVGHCVIVPIVAIKTEDGEGGTIDWFPPDPQNV